MVQFSAAVCGEERCVTTQRTALKQTIVYNNNGRNSFFILIMISIVTKEVSCSVNFSRVSKTFFSPENQLVNTRNT